MITIKIDGLDKVQRMIGEAGKQAKFAAAVALTKTAGKIRDELQAEMARDLTSASPYSLKSQFISPAKPAKLEAIVGIKNFKPSRGVAPATLLKEHFDGGVRGSKPMEVAMRALGALPDGYRVVPAGGMKLDRYGNPNKAMVAEVLGGLRSGMRVFSGRGKRAAEFGYFVAPVQRTARSRNLTPGIYRRVARSGSKAIVPVFLFIRAPGYRKLFDLPALGRRVVERDFNSIFNAAFTAALRTAR